MKQHMKQHMKKHTMVRIFSICLLVCFFTNLSAQNLQWSGVVKDASGEPLVGVSIRVKGNAKTGTITDIQGNFTISAPEKSTLIFSYIGYITQTITASPNMHVMLAEESKMLNEVVAIGYGTTRKKDLTASVGSLSGKSIEQIPVTGTAEALSGRIAGVQITTADGSPDADIFVRVRGGGSITQSNTPLYIIDGFPADNLNTISIQDIQSIDVLKDASSTAIYGSRGANGVILITTKQAKAGKTQISYSGFVQTKKLSKHLSVLNPYEYVKAAYEQASLGFNGTSLTGSSNSFDRIFGIYQDIDLYKYQSGTDWQSNMFGANVVSQQHSLSISGGTDVTKFAINTTFNKDGSLLPQNNYKRFTSNMKLDHQISKNLKMTLNFRMADITVNGSGTSGSTYKIRTSQAVTTAPVKGLADLQPVDIASMSEEEYQAWLESNMSLSEQSQQYWQRRYQREYNLLSAIEWKITKDLTLRTEGGYQYSYSDQQNYWGSKTTNAINESYGLPEVQLQKVFGTQARVSPTLTYSKLFEHNNRITAMVGAEYIENNSNTNTVKVIEFSKYYSPDKIFANLGFGTPSSTSSYNAKPYIRQSFMSRVNYSLKDKYLAALTFRVDGTNRFKKENYWGYFPAFSSGWRISEENFMKNSKKWLSNLKIRYGFGISGNSNIADGLIDPMYTVSSTNDYAIGDVMNPYYTTSSNLANPHLKWESDYTNTLGLDFGFFDERISGSVEIYKNTNKDLLLQVPITAPGYTTTYKNIGQTSNKGLEVTINGEILRQKNFSLSANFNIAFNKTNVDKLADNVPYMQFASGWAGTDSKNQYDYRIMVGQPIGLMYGWVSDGYYTTKDFLGYDKTANKYTLKSGVPSCALNGAGIFSSGNFPGQQKFKDLNGDGVIDGNDLTVIGKASPKFTGGFGFNGRIYDFDFQLLFNYVYGNSIYNANKMASTQNYRASTYANYLGIMSENNRYSYIDNSGNLVTSLSQLAAMNEGANAKQMWTPYSYGTATIMPNSSAIEDGSYLRFQNATVGYTIPKKISRKFLIEQFRVYCTLNNIYCLTHYSGYDPEVSSPVRGSSSTSMLTPGVDYSSYPKSFSWLFGINVTF
jgi:TonB-linked outer membrane protein, SusC/RagA family